MVAFVVVWCFWLGGTFETWNNCGCQFLSFLFFFFFYFSTEQIRSLPSTFIYLFIFVNRDFSIHSRLLFVVFLSYMDNTPSPKSESVAGPSTSGADFKLNFNDAGLISTEAAQHELEGRQYYGRLSANSRTNTSSNLTYRQVHNQNGSSHASSVTISHDHHNSKHHGTGNHRAHHDSISEGSNSKLGTFEGVFIPTTLNVLSILMFLRFGFILGQTGILGMLLLLTISYGIDLLTTLSVSAIATNGTVKGGGAYYMISRSLGPEFGGSIGLVFYIGQVLNAYVLSKSIFFQLPYRPFEFIWILTLSSFFFSEA